MENERRIDYRRKQDRITNWYQFTIVTLLLVILSVGIFHYMSLRIAQSSMLEDLIQVRMQYVQLRTYITGQTDQDKKIDQLKKNIDEVEKLVKQKYPERKQSR